MVSVNNRCCTYTIKVYWCYTIVEYTVKVCKVIQWKAIAIPKTIKYFTVLCQSYNLIAHGIMTKEDSYFLVLRKATGL